MKYNNTHRLKDNPMEELFSKAWENERPEKLLGYLMAKEINKPETADLTDRDIEVATTVIQWLGSPVGQYFLLQTLQEANDKNIPHRLKELKYGNL